MRDAGYPTYKIEAVSVIETASGRMAVFTLIYNQR